MNSRTGILMLSAAAAVLSPAPVHAQLDDPTISSVLRECRKIADAAARMACYDNIPISEAPQSVQSPMPSREGFGSNQLPRQAPARASAPKELVVKVTRTEEREPGVYLLVLEDGAQWQFVDAVSGSYNSPRAGSMIEITAASMGSYLMRYGGQRGIRVRRIR